MRQRWLRLALGALTVGSSGIARADGVGCCQVECHVFDDSGACLHSVQRTKMTQTECESLFPDCKVSWLQEECGGVGREVGIYRHPDNEEP
jgi:hypothetical protein